MNKMKWTPEHDSKLLSLVFKKAKLTKTDYEEYAAVIGDGCNALAVKNHLYKMLAQLGNPGSSTASRAKGSKSGSPNKGTPKPNGKASKPAKRKRSEDGDDDAEDFVMAPKKVKEELTLKEEHNVA